MGSGSSTLQQSVTGPKKKTSIKQELKVFQCHYNELVAVLPVEIGPEFVGHRIITTKKFNAIRTGPPNNVIMDLLEQVSSPLETGDINPFKQMLDIMENHGTETVNQLAKKIRKDLNQDVITKDPESSINDTSDQSNSESPANPKHEIIKAASLLSLHKATSEYSSIESTEIVMTAAPAQDDLVTCIKKKLEQQNYTVYCNTEISSSAICKVAKETITCKVFVLIAGAESVASEQVAAAVALAYISNRPILIVTTDKPSTLLSNMVLVIKMITRRLTWITFSSPSDEAAFSQLEEAIKDNTCSKRNGATQSEPPPTTRRLYNHQIEKSRKLESIDEEDNFWDRKFGKSMQVPWDQFQAAFQTEFAAKITELYNSNEDWLFSQIKHMLGATDRVNKSKFLDVMRMGKSDHEDHFWKVINDIATENYCMKEVFNMRSAVRLPAIENLGRFQTAAVIDALISLLHDDDPNVRAIAAISLGQTGTKEAHTVDRIIALLDDDDRICRQSACLSLGRMKAEKAVQKISHIWRNDYISVVRDAAKTALKQIGGTLADETLWMTERLQNEIDDLEKNPK